MIEGITVLNQTELLYKPNVVITIACAIIITVIAALFASLFDFSLWTAPVGFILGCLVVYGLTTVFNIPIYVPSGRYRYECLIDESVSMTDVYERFEIIERREDIWVLEDKE